VGLFWERQNTQEWKDQTFLNAENFQSFGHESLEPFFFPGASLA
jgi:hypothetical protein